MKRFSHIFSALILALLVACSAPTEPTPWEPTPTPPTPSSPGTISGTIRGTEAIGRPFEIPVGAEYVPGEVIVAFMDDTPGTVRVAGIELQSIRTLSVPDANLFSTGSADPVEVAAYLNAQPHVRYAHPNYIMRPMAVNPDDEYWTDEPDWFWNYRAIDAPGAWDITTGSSDIVVAVIDSGILVDQTGQGRPSHPDLVDSVLPGYDFVSEGARGHGRNDDPYDLGDHARNTDPYHGTHVAGTIGATTNNGIGIPGVGWDTSILPLRVFKDGGASMTDVMDAAMWAAGLHVPGVPGNPAANHADVLNMSLGAIGSCNGFIYDVFETITRDTTAIPIVAAGNSSTNVNRLTPANCPQVITVAASGYIPGNPADAQLAWYSNYGNLVDVVAPGGDMKNRPQDNGIFSTWATEHGDPTYGWTQGTSMAAPHVSGVVALMKSINPGLTTEQVRAMLRNTATEMQCAKPCGAGLVNARAALERVSVPSVDIVDMEFSPHLLDFYLDMEQLSMRITNNGVNNIQVKMEIAPDASTPDGWVTGPETITVHSGQTAHVTFTAHREVLTHGGSFHGVVYFFDAVTDKFLGLTSLLVDKPGAPPDAEERDYAMYLLSFVPDPRAPDGWADSAYHRASAPFERFENVTALPGENLIVAVIYPDGPGPLSPGDWFGTPRGSVLVQAGRNSQVPVFTIAPYQSGQYNLEIPEERVWQALQSALANEARDMEHEE